MAGDGGSKRISTQHNICRANWMNIYGLFQLKKSLAVQSATAGITKTVLPSSCYRTTHEKFIVEISQAVKVKQHTKKFPFVLLILWAHFLSARLLCDSSNISSINVWHITKHLRKQTQEFLEHIYLGIYDVLLLLLSRVLPLPSFSLPSTGLKPWDEGKQFCAWEFYEVRCEELMLSPHCMLYTIVEDGKLFDCNRRERVNGATLLPG